LPSADPPNTGVALGRYEAIANEYLKIANGSTAIAILCMPGRDCRILIEFGRFFPFGIFSSSLRVMLPVSHYADVYISYSLYM
jgi:hypothetical protein